MSVDYEVEETSRGVWRRCTGPDGKKFAEYTSHARLFGTPFVHYTRGRCPETGKAVTARGIVAVGKFARGVVAIGQFAVGLVAIGQIAFGMLLGLGQLATGVVAVGQVALGVLCGLGQVATGYLVIGQLGYGEYILAQKGLGSHVWDMTQGDPDAKAFFRSLLP